MPLLTLIVALIIVGVGLYLINTYIPMAPAVKTILNVVIILVCVIAVLDAVGVWASLASYRIGR